MITVDFVHPFLGHEPIEWDPDKPGELERMIAWFKEKIDAGFHAFAFKKGEKVGKLINKFDETAEKIILTSSRIKVVQPPIRG